MIGISSDSIESHGSFREKYFLNFILLSDEEHKVADVFGSWNNENNIMERHTFLLNGDGIIMKEWRDVDVGNHADNVFDTL